MALTRPLPLEQAERVVQGALAKARELGIDITVAVVDGGGYLVALSRMERVRFAVVDVAWGKAFTAAAFQREAQIMPPSPFFMSGFQVAGSQVVPLQAGLPLRDGDYILGAVGCAGGTGEQDRECSQAGLAVLQSGAALMKEEPLPAEERPDEILTLGQAMGMAGKALQKASELGVGVSVAVVDHYGHLLVVRRMDGVGFFTTDIARHKAFTAVAFRAETAQLAERLGQVPFFAGGPNVTGGRLVFLGGGVPVRRDGRVVGAIGVAGARVEQDEECARAGLTALPV